MSRWFRFYDDALNDPKVQTLSGDLFKAWVNLLCLASRNGGTINSAADAAFALRISDTKAARIVASLASKGLLDRVPGGYFAPHNWSTRQYKSDTLDPTNAERQQRYRERKRNAKTVTPTVTTTVTTTVTPTVTVKRPETETETEQKGSEAIASDATASPPAQTVYGVPAAKPIYTDAKHELWGEGPDILVSLGVPARQARSMIGRWMREAKDDAERVLGAIQRARDSRVQEPIAWITRAINTERTNARPGQSNLASTLARLCSEAERIRQSAVSGSGPDASRVLQIGGRERS